MDVGLATPLEVFQSLAAEGFQITYRRIPLSRERTPEAADLDVLHSQLLLQPEGLSVIHGQHGLHGCLLATAAAAHQCQPGESRVGRQSKDRRLASP